MSLKKFAGWVLCLAIALVFAPGPVQARVYIDINQPFARKIPIAAPDFQPLNPAGRAPDEISVGLPALLTQNLDFTGMFIALDKRTFREENPRAGLGQGDSVNFQEWRRIGGELLVKGGFDLIGEQLTMELRLYDVFEGRLVLGKKYTGGPANARTMINKFTNEILRQLTGRPGVFGTKIVFFRRQGHHQGNLYD